jgi:serine/threonine protein kinase
MKRSSPHEEEIFAAAMALPASERAGYLERACADNPELRAHVHNLLDAVDDAARFVREPANISQQDAAGDRIGAYRLLEEIGEGGGGTVYRAEQLAPVKREVALKIIKPGMDTRAVINRFEAERQALAMMDHPNIAQVFDAGATPTGRPYFVMELVRGIRITPYCDQCRLSIPERLALFIQVCHAIQHAHLKGVIHRDIKPSNVLVTLHDGAPVAKVIDFGIAKAMQGRLADQTLHTMVDQFVGTPA